MSRDNRRLGSLAGGFPKVGFDNVEAHQFQLVAKVTHRPPVCRGNCVSELLDDRALEETDKQHSIGSEYPAELSKGNADRAGFVVDE